MEVSDRDKQILRIALNEITGFSFYPISLINYRNEDYYFICKVKSIIKNLKIDIVRVYIKIHEKKGPILLSIEEIKQEQ